jgi:glycerate dehydrogenase
MRIVIIDGYTLNPGDLSWEPLKEFGDVVLYDRTREDLITELCRDAEIILTNKAPLSARTIEAASGLKLICVTATGFNIVDVEFAARRSIPVCNVPNYGTSSVAQHTFALILEMTNLVGLNGASVQGGAWQRSPDFCFSKGRITELQGKTLGLIGFGKIGQQVARLAAAFDMRVIYNSNTRKESQEANYVDLDTVLTESDIVSLHCPLTKSNRHFIDNNLLSRMKPTARIVNTSRGQLIQEQDLADALNSGRLAGAALDVLSIEPPRPDNPLLTAKNCLITPHTAWMSLEARTRILQATVQNIESYVAGKPINVVSM